MSTRIRALPIVLALLPVALSAPCLAERQDREKPAQLEADKVTVDDRNRVHTFEGNVRLAQGSLLIQADKIVVTQDGEGFHKGVATGHPARFRQKREARHDQVEGEAERIEHDSRSERTRMYKQAVLKVGDDEVRGQFIDYDATTEQYLVTGSPGGTAAAGGDTRVRAVIQPRNKATPAPASSR